MRTVTRAHPAARAHVFGLRMRSWRTLRLTLRRTVTRLPLRVTRTRLVTVVVTVRRAPMSSVRQRSVKTTPGSVGIAAAKPVALSS